MDLNDRTAPVTGGADGIGSGIAERLAAEGMHVDIAELDQKTGSVTAERIGGSFLTDVAAEGGVRAALEAAGPVTVLVNNAGASSSRVSPRRSRRSGSTRST